VDTLIQKIECLAKENIALKKEIKELQKVDKKSKKKIAKKEKNKEVGGKTPSLF